MAYEYLVEVARLKKLLDAREVMDGLVKAGFKPVAVRVDNERGQILIYFNRELGGEEKKELDAFIATYIKRLSA